MILALSLPCFAEETVEPVFQTAGLNVQGDTILYFDGTAGVALGVKLGTFRGGVWEVRAEVAQDKMGVGLSTNLPKLIEKAGGTWEAVNFNPSIGLVLMTDLNDIRESAIGINANLIELKF
jgi:hypothetical protein